MPTVRAALESLEASLFVDRQREAEQFTRWLAAGSSRPDILQVTGHAGVGKSALLREFARTAPALGRQPVVYVDGEAIAPTPADFILAVTGDADADPASHLGDQPALLMIDGMDALSPLTRWLTRELMPALDQNVRVVVAGRQPLGPMWKRWQAAMQTIRLDSLAPDAASAYLERRGVDPAVAQQILAAAGGYPLALTLAADLAVQRGVTRFEKAPEWKLTLRALVEALIQDAPSLRSMLEAAAVVRQFDEPTLAAITGLEDPSHAFAELCSVSFVRPAQHGLTLHEDIRRTVIEELQWRDPGRLAQLRRQARAYFRDRLRERRSGEEWLVPERIYLWDTTVRSVYFPGGEPSTMWVEAGGPANLDELVSIQTDWIALLQAGVPLPSSPPPEECSPEFLRAVVSLPGTEVLIARTPDGYAHGYGFFLPISQAALEILPRGGALATLVERGLPEDVRRSIPPTAEGSRVLYMSADAARGARAGEAIGALAADTFRLALRGYLFIACTGETTVQVPQALGMTCIPDVGMTEMEPRQSLNGWVLDIGRIGPDRWLEAVTSGRPLPPEMSVEEIERELHEVLVHWRDEARLAASPLAQLASYEISPDEASAPAETLREAIRGALTDARASQGDDLQLACHALEVAYFERQLAHEAIAERLNVSRSSFYRLLHRAEHEIASRLTAPH